MGGLVNSSMEEILALIVPLVVLIFLGIVGMAIGGIIVGKLLKLTWQMSFAIALNCLIGFPVNFLLTNEAINVLAKTEEEKDFLYNSELSLSYNIFGDSFKFKGEVQTVKEGDMIGDFKVIDTPGHTIGSKCFYDEKSKILISGDTLFRRSYGRYDLPTGDLNMLCNSLEKLSKLPEETVVYNGHTDETTIGEEKIFLGRVGIL